VHRGREDEFASRDEVETAARKGEGRGFTDQRSWAHRPGRHVKRMRTNRLAGVTEQKRPSHTRTPPSSCGVHRVCDRSTETKRWGAALSSPTIADFPRPPSSTEPSVHIRKAEGVSKRQASRHQRRSLSPTRKVRGALPRDVGCLRARVVKRRRASTRSRPRLGFWRRWQLLPTAAGDSHHVGRYPHLPEVAQIV